MAVQSSQRLPELLFYTKKSYRILQLQFQLQFQLQCYTCTLHYNPENSPSRIQFYMQKTKSSSRYYIPVSRNSTHRRQGDLLEMHPCVLQDLPVIFQAFQPQVLTKATPVTPIAPETFQTFQSFMTFQPFQAILQCSSISRESTPFQHSPIRMHILQFYNSYSSIGFHRKLHRVPVGQLQTLQTFILQRKGDVVISVKLIYSPE